MVFIIGASSLRAGIESTSGNQRKELSRKPFYVRRLSLKPNSISQILNLGFLLRRGKLKFKTNIVLWHDVISNTITEHRLNYNRAETVDSLIATLRKFSHRIPAIIYCQREGSSYIFEELVSNGILVIPAAKKLISKRNQKDRWHQEYLGEVHLAKSVERRFIHTILKGSGNLKYIVKRNDLSTENDHLRSEISEKANPKKDHRRKSPNKVSFSFFSCSFLEHLFRSGLGIDRVVSSLFLL